MKIFKKIGLSVALLTLVAIFGVLAHPKKAAAGTSIDQAYAGCVENVLNVVIKGNTGDNAQQCKLDDTNGYADLNYATQEVQGIKLANYKASSTTTTVKSNGVTLKVPDGIEILDQNNQPLVFTSQSQALAYENLKFIRAENTHTFYNDTNIFEIYQPTGGDQAFSFLTMIDSNGSFKILALVNNTIHSGSPDYVYAASINKQAEGSNATGSPTPNANVGCTVTSGTSTQNCGSGGGGTSGSCEDNFNSPFGWLICPAFSLADDAAGSFADFINDQLCFKTTNNSTSSTGTTVVCDGSNNLTTPVHNAWSIFKNIASSLIVIVMLVMVISQAIGGGPFDAYTVRKMLPKLVAAVIIMQISWLLMKWAIDLSNDLGAAIGSLIQAPFGGPDNLKLQELMGKAFGAHSGWTNTALGVSFYAIAGWTLLAAGSVPGLLLVALYVVLAVFTAFVVLLLRKLLIIALVLFAPLAFIMWILPGTERYWKMWSSNFMKLLAMYPLIMGLIAAGRVFAYVTANNSTTSFMRVPPLAIAHFGPLPVPYVASVSNFVEMAIIIGAYFAPYYLLPQTYKWGGAAMSAIGQGASKGVEQLGKPGTEFLKWRKGFSRAALAKAQRRSIKEQLAKNAFAENLADENSIRGSINRARLYNIDSIKGNREVVARSVRAARGQQAQEAGKELQAYFDALGLDIYNKDKGNAADFMSGNPNTAMGVLGNKFRTAKDDSERQAILKRVAQFKDVDSLKAARDIAGSEEWHKYSTSGYLYDDFKSLDPQLFMEDNTPGRFFNAAGSIDHNDDLLAGMTLQGWQDLWAEATIRGQQGKVLAAIERIKESPAGDHLDNKVRDYMDSVTPPPPPTPTPPPVASPGPGAVIPPEGISFHPASPEGRVVSATDADIQNWVQSLPKGPGGSEWESLSDDDLENIYNYRSGGLKDRAQQELQRRNRFPS